MFKKEFIAVSRISQCANCFSLSPQRGEGLRVRGGNFQTKRPIFFRWTFLLPLIFLTACRSLPPLPQVNFNEPGWKIRQGQAVWQPNKTAPEIVGEILVATNSNENSFVQFTKTPMPFAVAQKTPTVWQAEFPMQNKRYTFHGKPPARIIWLHLPDALSGKTLGAAWKFQSFDAAHSLLKNNSTGESLEIFFTQ
jgi:hypothetical protein